MSKAKRKSDCGKIQLVPSRNLRVEASVDRVSPAGQRIMDLSLVKTESGWSEAGWVQFRRVGRRLLKLSLGLVALSFLSACSHVSPWQRAHLADPIMQADRDPLDTMFAEHIWFSREAAAGGRGVGGGGCGCN